MSDGHPDRDREDKIIIRAPTSTPWHDLTGATIIDPSQSAVDHPAHYGGADNPYEAIKVIEAWNLDFCLGNAVKYISRAGKKTPDAKQDLEKAIWYLQRRLKQIGGEP